MQFKTRGIVLKFIKYRETSIIVAIYTEGLGLQRYIVNGVRTKRPKISVALFQPLTLVSLVVYHNPNRELHRISEIKCQFPFRSIPFQVKKTTIALFISEVLGKSLKEDHEDPPLFDFLYGSILALDELALSPDNFHLQFMLKLTRYLGFEPESPRLILQELNSQGQNHSASDQELRLLQQLKINGYLESPMISSNSIRRKMLGLLVDFYTLHITSFARIKSPKVLMEVIK